MGKIDLHTHSTLKRYNTGRVNPFNPLDCYTADFHELKEHLKNQHIDKAVLMSSGENVVASNNEECYAISHEDPEFYAWMCNLDGKDINTVYNRLAACKEQGAVGVGELFINEWMDSPFLTAVFEAAEKLNMPVTIHMSPEPGYAYGVCDHAKLPLLEQTLQRFPNLKLIGHSQLFWLEISADCPQSGNQERTSMGQGPVIPGGRVEQLMDRYQNLYGDLSAYSGSCAILRDEEYGLAFLEKFSERLFFATDTVNKYQVFPLGKKLDQYVEEGKLSRTSWENICYGNARRIFNL